ncbi:hypothetical protein L917_12420, partial [Phytophthora nicotianae]
SGVTSAGAASTQNTMIAVNEIKEIKTSGPTERFLRRHDELGAEATEERIATGPIALNNRMINKLAKLEDKVVDPKLADKLLEGTILQKKLDSALSLSGRNKLFESLRAEGVDPNALSKVIKMHPAIEKKYRIVYTMHEGYVKVADAKRLAKLKRKRTDS